MVKSTVVQTWSFCEFFAGGGMARAGLGPDWNCTFANDFDAMKAQTYRANWGDDHFVEGDVAQVTASALPGRPDMVWASFPCQDLSLAGNCRGLGDQSDSKLTRSGTFWPFWSIMENLRMEGRSPRLIVLENVPGTISSRGGKDFAAICCALAEADYRLGAIIVDAKRFVPQSRPRLFFIAVADDIPVLANMFRLEPQDAWHSDALRGAVQNLPQHVRDKWIWWAMPLPPPRNSVLSDLIDEEPEGCHWNTQNETEKLLGMMAPLHLAKIDKAATSGRKLVGSIYKRTRLDECGVKTQRAEVRFDDIAGCLRTPGGGSSRQTIIVVDGEAIRSRLLSPREAARLMGLAEDYRLPMRYNDAYKVAGDGVCVPVVRHLAASLLEPILNSEACANQSLAA